LRPSHRGRSRAPPIWAATVRATPTTFDDLLARKQGDIAIVATPPAAHVDAAVALLDVGYHVVVEAHWRARSPRPTG
jgi:predicted dehydrogenase